MLLPFLLPAQNPHSELSDTCPTFPSEFPEAPGVIFLDIHAQLIPVHTYKKAFTPSQAEVLEAELLLRQQIHVLDSSSAAKGYITQPVIRRNLYNYHRQYFGLVEMDGSKTIWVNFLWSDEIGVFNWQCKYTPVVEGDTWFWSIYIDLEEKKCYNLEVGGS